MKVFINLFFILLSFCYFQIDAMDLLCGLFCNSVEYPEQNGWPETITVAYLKIIKALPDQDPAPDASLEWDQVMTPFWLRIAREGTSEEKNDCFKKIVLNGSVFTQGQYNLWRTQAMASAYAQADLNNVLPREQTVLSKAVAHDDQALAQGLLEQGADPNLEHRSYDCETPLSLASTFSMATLLVKHGASIIRSNRFFMNAYGSSRSLLHHVIEQDYQPELLSFYLNNGIDIDQHFALRKTALAYLIKHELDGSHTFDDYFDQFKKTGIDADELRTLAASKKEQGPDRIIDREQFEQKIKTIENYLQTVEKHVLEPECCICFQLEGDVLRLSGSQLIPIHQHSDAICPNCLSSLSECPICRDKL